MDLVELEEKFWNIAEVLPAVTNSTAPFMFIMQARAALRFSGSFMWSTITVLAVGRCRSKRTGVILDQIQDLICQHKCTNCITSNVSMLAVLMSTVFRMSSSVSAVV